MKRRSSRLHRRRRFKVRRRTQKGRRTRFGRSRRFRSRRSGRSLAIPTRACKELSYVFSFTSSAGIHAEENIWHSGAVTANISQLGLGAFVALFKEWRLTHYLVAVRRRYPEPVAYQPNTQEQTVAASRLTTNNIWWVPWGKADPPAYPPRMIKSARLLSSRWTVARIQARVPVFQWTGAMDSTLSNTGLELGGAMLVSEFLAGTTPAASRYRSQMTIRPRWGRTPWTSMGSANPGSNMSIFTGFYLVENESIVPDDDLEVRIKVYYSFKSRKNLAGYGTDNTGAFTVAPALSFQPLDRLGTAPKVGYLEENLHKQHHSGLPVEEPRITDTPKVDTSGMTRPL